MVSAHGSNRVVVSWKALVDFVNNFGTGYKFLFGNEYHRVLAPFVLVLADAYGAPPPSKSLQSRKRVDRSGQFVSLKRPPTIFTFIWYINPPSFKGILIGANKLSIFLVHLFLVGRLDVANQVAARPTGAIDSATPEEDVLLLAL